MLLALNLLVALFNSKSQLEAEILRSVSIVSGHKREIA
jgi:hypothetical protein